jgi:hypothetical protein
MAGRPPSAAGLVKFAPMSEVASPPSGCLTDAQLAELQAAAPGQAPEALARHLASCERCQARALFGAARPVGKKKPVPEFPSVRRAVFLAALVLFAMAAFFWSLAKLSGRLQ